MLALLFKAFKSKRDGFLLFFPSFLGISQDSLTASLTVLERETPAWVPEVEDPVSEMSAQHAASAKVAKEKEEAASEA